MSTVPGGNAVARAQPVRSLILCTTTISLSTDPILVPLYPLWHHPWSTISTRYKRNSTSRDVGIASSHIPNQEHHNQQRKIRGQLRRSFQRLLPHQGATTGTRCPNLTLFGEISDGKENRESIRLSGGRFTSNFAAL